MNTPKDLKSYRDQLARALADPFLGQALANFAAAYPGSRAHALAGLDFPALSREIAAGKDAALSQLEELYQAFKTRAEAAGAHVHLASNAAEANRLIAAIAQEAGAELVVKSKSMTAEETHLNDYLESRGLTVRETDLGEWIIQLRHEGPSHMVMPAIHLSRAQVADLFREVTGQDLDPDDIAGMVKVARRELRRAFLAADVGISGANFAIAATGTLGLVTNEGNARLVTTLPRVHIALVGLDKLVPDLATALRVLRLLPKNATGQAISSYVTWITGANACAAAPDGKKEMHIVFLDNGRLALARDPVFSQALRCVRCGACANVCPVYGLVGGHNYGHVYIGAIGLILTYFYHGRDNARAIVQNCLNCQACKSVCPAGIDLPALIKKVHGLILADDRHRPAKNRLLARVLKDRRLFHFLLRRARLAQKPLAGKKDVIRHLPFFFDPRHSFRSLPVLAASPLRDRWSRLRPVVKEPKLRIALFAGCLVDFVYPGQAQAFLELLRGRDIAVDFPPDQTCCGLPAQMLAEEDTARDVARQNLAALDPAAYDYVVTLCASCASHLKENYPRLLAGDPGHGVKAAQMAGKILDASSFLRDVVGLEPPAEVSGQKTAYHAPCHLCRGLGVHEAPRQLLAEHTGQYLPLANEEVCCGFGGSFSVAFPELSARILENKLRQVAESGAEVLVTDCPGCVLQLAGGLDQQGSAVRAEHLVETLVRARRPKPAPPRPEPVPSPEN
ncbi:MAG: LUD domain-containing protein [Deltaproteobacteria bacterium]|nr:LUD domain-containing protein [Deltaproteobacteria bacterium]